MDNLVNKLRSISVIAGYLAKNGCTPVWEVSKDSANFACDKNNERLGREFMCATCTVSKEHRDGIIVITELAHRIEHGEILYAETIGTNDTGSK